MTTRSSSSCDDSGWPDLLWRPWSSVPNGMRCVVPVGVNAHETAAVLKAGDPDGGYVVSEDEAGRLVITYVPSDPPPPDVSGVWRQEGRLYLTLSPKSHYDFAAYSRHPVVLEEAARRAADLIPGVIGMRSNVVPLAPSDPWAKDDVLDVIGLPDEEEKLLDYSRRGLALGVTHLYRIARQYYRASISGVDRETLAKAINPCYEEMATLAPKIEALLAKVSAQAGGTA